MLPKATVEAGAVVVVVAAGHPGSGRSTFPGREEEDEDPNAAAAAGGTAVVPDPRTIGEMADCCWCW